MFFLGEALRWRGFSVLVCSFGGIATGFATGGKMAIEILRPTLRNGAKDGAPERLWLVES
jgi:hypothetical protein